MQYFKDNIVAIATGSQASGVGIIRVSGTQLNKLFKPLLNKEDLKPRQAHLVNILDAKEGILDSGLALFFLAPNSFTGEEVLELQTHGSPVILNLILKRLLALGCRLATPGEFTKRAYFNNKLDLIQAESIADLIHAGSEAQARGAVNSLKGEFSNLIKHLNTKLIELRMFVEASLDFPEEDIEFILEAKIYDKLSQIQAQIEKILISSRQGALLNNGVSLVIIGQPNVGKSSLLNALSGEEVAIVTDVPGTTRDLIRQQIVIEGLIFNVIDTAGIRKTEDIVEKIGINRALEALKAADIALILCDDRHGVGASEDYILAQLPTNLTLIYVYNKIDLTNSFSQIIKTNNNLTQIYLSAKSGLGINLLKQELLKQVGFNLNLESTFIARTRHVALLEQAKQHINQASNCILGLEFMAEELRYAHNSLGEIVGEFTTDDLLGEIFSRFCIGK